MCCANNKGYQHSGGTLCACEVKRAKVFMKHSEEQGEYLVRDISQTY